MRDNTKSIYQLINHKNKNCKLQDKNCKNGAKIGKTAYYCLHTSSVFSKIKKVCSRQVNLFPQWQITNNKGLLINCSQYTTDKINGTVQLFRGVRGKPLIELVAKDCAKMIITKSGLTAEDYINSRYGFCNFYKKELQMLPCLILNNLLASVANIAKLLQSLQHGVMMGAKAIRTASIYDWKEEKLYGFVKYNKNTLKVSGITTEKINKCVYYFIVKLNKQEMYLQNAITNIEVLFKRYCNSSKKYN